MSSPAKSQNGAAEADAAALAEAERLALEKIGGTPKKKPAAAEDNLGKPKATSKKKATPTKKAAPKKALKRPAANKVQDQDDPSGTADQEDDGKEKGLETKATKSKAKKKDVEKAKKLKLEEPQEAQKAKEPGQLQAVQSAGKEVRDYAKAGFFHRNFNKLPEEARSGFSFCVYFQEHVSCLFVSCHAARCRRLSAAKI